ncbi:pre-toxin TG domain-containing protein [Pseudobacteriovorax antillogorgiicola]|uniref:Pre-toxin TG n=1 Tax=Pseudobacteriovorax antillogorgiicola TaxID=1513793 RepID=A0A1Y6BW35_9BACT|nr:pre-toxin TG domain-containing protein [Pseudobacteriovorax antillogorgiicola]TCS53707.1 putative toxin of predicted polymorphic toxin system [Pseudobacteriovorax antillogorgiicola]SMF22967.1 Pre-toxin TG [Pseudobacteriovorax antillogorgiicola]
MQIVKLAFLYLSVLFLFGCDPDSINDHGHCRGGGCQINGGSIYQYGEQKEDPCSNWVAPIECHSPDDRERPPPEDTTGNSGSTPEPIPSDPDELPSYDPERDDLPVPNYDLGDLTKSWGNLEEGVKNAFGEVTGENARKRREAKRKKALVDQIQATVDKIQAHLKALDDLKPGLSTSVGSSHQWVRENGIEKFTTAITGDVNGYNSEMQGVIDGVPTVELDYGQLPNGQAAVYVEQRELIATQGYVEAIREEVYTRYQGDGTFQQRVTLVNASEAAIQVADQAYRKGEYEEGDIARKIALLAADAALNLNPVGSMASDLHVLLTGKNMVTGEEVSDFEYWTSVAGVATAGIGSSSIKVGKTIVKIADLIGDTVVKAERAKKIRRIFSLQSILKMKEPKKLEVISRSLKKDPNPHWQQSSEALGGKHGLIQGKVPGNESHHMPAKAASPVSEYNGSAISMKREHHRQTASVGNTQAAKDYRARQKELIERGRFRDALQMDIDDVRSKFDHMYDKEIKEMLDYIDSLGL